MVITSEEKCNRGCVMAVKLVRATEPVRFVLALEKDKERLKRATGIEPKDGKVYPVFGGERAVFWGYAEDISPEGLRKIAGKMIWLLQDAFIGQAYFEMPEWVDVEGAKALAEGFVLAGYSFDRFKKEKTPSVEVFVKAEDSLWWAMLKAAREAEITNYVRDLVNMPGEKFVPETFAKEALKQCFEPPFEVKVFKGEELLDIGFYGTYTVGKGSKNSPVFVHMSYKPEGSKGKVVFVGKGITFDSGGLSIKPSASMETMKMDKAGACTLLGLAKYVEKVRPQVEIHFLIPSAENMPDGSSYRPDDIVVFKNGKSVEIHSTDAEGRLLLADALIYASSLKPDVVVDVATLTGACVVALGQYTAGAFSNNFSLRSLLEDCASKTGEKLWFLPLDEDLKDELKTPHADLRNNAKSRYGGAITAALFLKEFVDDKIPWAHIDIAGPAYLKSKWKYYREGATGVPVRTLMRFIQNYPFE